MKMPRLTPLAIGLALAAPLFAQAAIVNSTYKSLGGNDWSVDFTVVNDGAPASITGFSVYFPETDFANLSVAASPGEWDALTVQPDLGLPSPGFLDAFVLDDANALTWGLSQGGFQVHFTYLGAEAPGSLDFTINAPDFSVVFAGATNVIPEPSAVLLAAFGLGAIGWGRRRIRTDAKSLAEVAA